MAEEEDMMVDAIPVPATEDNDADINVDYSDGNGSIIHLSTIWDDGMIEKGISSWKCLWCKKIFKG
jgi:hypothetical protein